MVNGKNSRPRALPMTLFLLLSVVAGTAAGLSADQKGNTAAAADAATVGQHTQYPASKAQSSPITSSRSQDPLASMKARQKRELKKMRFEKMKEHAGQLAEMAQSLQEDIEKSNENVLSLEIVDKAKKIEKLAKKIRNEARSGL